MQHDMTIMHPYMMQIQQSTSPFDKHPIEHGLESLDVWVSEVINSDHPAYNKEMTQVAITEEIQGLMDRETFDLVLRNELPADANITGSRIELELKDYKTSEECIKARLVGHPGLR
jgi:hypothetical protein